MPGLAVCRRYAEQGQNIIAMFNADMIGYQEAGKPIVLGFMVRDSAAQRPPPRPNPPRDSTCSWVYESISIQVSPPIDVDINARPSPRLVWLEGSFYVCCAPRARARVSRSSSAQWTCRMDLLLSVK